MQIEDGKLILSIPSLNAERKIKLEIFRFQSRFDSGSMEWTDFYIRS